MASTGFVSMINSNFLASYKIFNVIKDKFQLLYNIIKYNNVEKSKYNDYLAIFVFKLLSYMVVTNA